MIKKVIAGNWKMNKLFSEADDFFDTIMEFVGDFDNLNNTEIIICPPSLYLELATDYSIDFPVHIGAQNASEHDFGPYTGEISPQMLAAMGVDFSIIGHSERRKYYHETDEVINKKLKNVLNAEITPIFCIGETLEQRENNQTKNVILSQLEKGLKDIEIYKNLYVAYEPVWAIGTGKNATPEQAEEVHSIIRNWLENKYSREIADSIPILYGGSVKPENLISLLSKQNINGALIGGASLDVEKFMKMIKDAVKLTK